MDNPFGLSGLRLGESFMDGIFRPGQGVKVYPHRLRHTCATQLLNAGCRVTSIQKFLGHKRLNSTMIYARVHDRTVAEDYYSAMARVEQRLDIAPPVTAEEDKGGEPLNDGEREQILDLAGQLAEPELSLDVRLSLVECLRQLMNRRLPDAEPPVTNENGRRPRAPPIPSAGIVSRLLLGRPNIAAPSICGKILSTTSPPKASWSATRQEWTCGGNQGHPAFSFAVRMQPIWSGPQIPAFRIPAYHQVDVRVPDGKTGSIGICERQDQQPVPLSIYKY